MALQFSAAYSSRVTKPRRKNALLKRSSSSKFSAFKQRKPVSRSYSKPERAFADDEAIFDDRLEDCGLAASLAADLSLRDVAQILKYVRGHMFDEIPETGGGFNSVRIAEVLNFRRILPPSVTVAHVHALSQNATTAEREIAELSRNGVVRKIVVPGRGTGRSSVSEGLVLSEDLEDMVNRSGLERAIADRLLAYLKANPLSITVPSTAFPATDITALKRTGFLTSSTQTNQPSNSLSHTSSPGTAASIISISRASSGSLAAIGGFNAIHEAGGSGTASGLRRSSSQSIPDAVSRAATPLQISLPNTGPYLRLLTTARNHVVSLLQKSRFREMPIYLLKERWDGGIAAEDEAAKAKRYRGEFHGVLPARTRKWREFYGVRFEWVLEEAVGAGVVEIFETGSVGKGVRLA